MDKKFNMKEYDRVRDKAMQSVKICVMIIAGISITKISEDLKCSRQLVEYYVGVLTQECD